MHLWSCIDPQNQKENIPICIRSFPTGREKGRQRSNQGNGDMFKDSQRYPRADKEWASPKIR
jgi:hypothetical protein